MANWYNVVILIAAVVLGFFLGTLRQKLFEKKVDLSHKLDAPAVFSATPPRVSFQNVKISNGGELPAKNLRISLNADVLREHDAIYKAITEQDYKEETKEGILTLRFETLLPRDELTISFKSSEPIPPGFLLIIKSDEMISKNESDQKNRYPEILQWVAAATAVVLVGFAGALSFQMMTRTHTAATELSEQPALSLAMMNDKPIYRKGDKVEITYQIMNLRKDILRDIRATVDIPGFDLSLDQRHMSVHWLGSTNRENQVTRKVFFTLPLDAPSGKHKVVLRVQARTLDNLVAQQAESFFEVQ